MKESIRLLRISDGIAFAKIYPNKNGFGWDMVELVGGNNRKDICRIVLQMLIGLLKPILKTDEK